jgi:hypothetical protein
MSGGYFVLTLLLKAGRVPAKRLKVHFEVSPGPGYYGESEQTNDAGTAE